MSTKEPQHLCTCNNKRYYKDEHGWKGDVTIQQQGLQSTQKIKSVAEYGGRLRSFQVTAGGWQVLNQKDVARNTQNEQSDKVDHLQVMMYWGMNLHTVAINATSYCLEYSSNVNVHFLLTCPLCWSPVPPPPKLPLLILLWASGSPAAGRPSSCGCPPAQSAPLGSGLLGL